MKTVKWILGILAAACVLCGCGKSSVEEKYTVEDIYREGLSSFLLQELDLEHYDGQLLESGMGYIANDEDDMSESQKMSRLGLTYIYLRNELHLERLTDEQQEKLKTEAANYHGTISDETMELITSTYANVITPQEIRTEADKEVETFYDSRLQPDLVKMNALVLMIGTMSEFDENGNYVSLEHEKEKTESLRSFAEEMERELAGRLGDVPIRVLVEN